MKRLFLIFICCISIFLIALLVFQYVISLHTTEDQSFTNQIANSFQGKKQEISVKDMYSEKWDTVCVIGPYESAEEALWLGKIKDVPLVTYNRIDHEFAESEWGLAFITSDHKATFFKVPSEIAHLSDAQAPRCMERDKAALKIKYEQKYYNEPVITLTEIGG